MVKLYEQNEALSRSSDLGPTERQRRSRDLMQRIAELQRRISEGKRAFNTSQAYREWQQNQAAVSRSQRIDGLRMRIEHARAKPDREKIKQLLDETRADRAAAGPS